MYELLKKEKDEIINFCIKNDASLSKEECDSEFLNFLCYLSLADSLINEDEIRFINSCFNLETDIKSMNKYIRDNEIYTKAFANKVPKVVACAKNIGLDFSIRVIDYFKELGLEFISCDEDVDKSEVESLFAYFSLLQYYLAD